MKNLIIVVNGDEKPVIGKVLYFVFNSGYALGDHQQKIMIFICTMVLYKAPVIDFKINVFTKAIDLPGLEFLNQLFDKGGKVFFLELTRLRELCFHNRDIFDFSDQKCGTAIP